MPRNDQVTRQWYLLRQLESSRGATLQELADALPDDSRKHLRTIRRDLDALTTTFSIYTDRVDGQTRWKLLEGSRQLPALSFSPTELMALTFSRHLLKPLEGTQIQASLDSALSKAAAALPPQGLAYVRQMQDLFSIGLGPHKTYRHHRDTIDRLTRERSPGGQARDAQGEGTGRSQKNPPAKVTSDATDGLLRWGQHRIRFGEPDTSTEGKGEHSR